MADQVSALIEYLRALGSFRESGERSGGDGEEEPPDREDVGKGGQLHNAVVALEAALGGKLPSPDPRDAWIALTDARDNVSDPKEWQEIAHACAYDMEGWGKDVMLKLIQRMEPQDIEKFVGEYKAEAFYEMKYRELAAKLIPGFEAPRDRDKMAALCSELGLQPSEFGKLSAKSRLAFAEAAIAKRTTEPQGQEIDELVTLNQCAPLCGVTKRTMERWLQSGKLPAPDIPGGDGRANKWYWRNLRPALQREVSRVLPERFPASRIV